MEYFFRPGERVVIVPGTVDPAASRGVVVREIARTATRNATVVVRLDYQGMRVTVAKVSVNPVEGE